jgi:ribosomal protein S6--L-glutamate ligase
VDNIGGARLRDEPEKLVAIAPFLRSCPQVVTLGVRTSMGDYTPEQRRMLLSAGQILFPTPRFVGILHASGKKTFPSAFAYSVQRSRLIQNVLFEFLKCPHPITRIYYGRQKSSIVEDFSFPFRAMGPNMTDCAGLVSNGRELRAVSEIYNPLIIQEVLEYEGFYRLIFINYECSGVLRRVSTERQRRFESREISPNPRLDPVTAPECFGVKIASYLEKLLRSVQISDIAAEIGITRGSWHLIELTRPPLSWPTSTGSANRYDLIARMIESKRL